MSQPEWRTLYCTDTDLVQVDATGVYEAEMEVAEEVDDGRDWCNCPTDDDGETAHVQGECELRPAKFEVFRFSLDRLKLARVDEEGAGYLVSAKYDAKWPHPLPNYTEWFDDDLDAIAQYVGIGRRADIVKLLCSEDVRDRASAYKAIGDYHGFRNLDGYPLDLTEAELNTRWGR